MSSETPTFSRLRSYLWPIHAYELRKFLPLFLMAFFIGFNYNILRNMKDALLVTAPESGAEVLPFIKVWGIIPGALIMLSIYSRLNNYLRRDHVFYVMIGGFLAFFALFAFLIYPFRESLHLHGPANFLQAHLPAGCKGLIAMIRYWSYSSFYIMSEMWSSAILSMLFWGFANDVTRLGEAKRFYGLIAIGLNFAAITSGQVSVFLTGNFLRSHLSFTQEAWHQSIILLTCTILLSGFAIAGIYRYVTKYVLGGTELRNEGEAPPKKIRMSMRKNFAYLARSKYLMSIAVIVLSYNIVINLVEVIWKDQVRQLYPAANDFNAYMSQITTITGIISCFLSFFIAGQVIRKFGWRLAALATPIILAVTCFGFFFFFFGSSSLVGTLVVFGTSPLALVVLFGSMQNCLSRAAKFTLFDATKEMAFIPLDRESKLKGKAAIDGVGSRIGKSGGSLIHQGLLVIFSSIAASAHIVAGLIFIAIALWIGAVASLGRRFSTLTTSQESAAAALEEPLPDAELEPEPEPAISR